MSKPFSSILCIGFGLIAFATGALIYVAQQQHAQLEALSSALASRAKPSVDEASREEWAREMAQLERRILRLERDVRQTRQPLAREPAQAAYALEGTRSAQASSRGASEPEPRQRITESAVMDLLESEDPVIQERMGEIVRREQERAFEERQAQFRVQVAERSRERVAQMAEEVALSVAQVDWINAALDSERERILDLFVAARKDGTFQEAQEEAQRIREETDESARRELDAEQLEAFQQMREEQGGPWGPPPRPRRAPGSGRRDDG